MDPRVKISSADLLALHQAESKLAALTSSSAEAALEAHSLREQIAKLAKDAPAALKASLDESDKQLAALLDGKEKSPTSEEMPGLDDVSGENAELYAQAGQVDAVPTAAQQKAAAHATEETEAALRSWNKWKDGSLPKLNSQLTAAHRSELNLQQRPEIMPEGGDED
jgi:small-conductance mechanosensitive channel